ncbi:TetR/AcrR family transcriptional regulator [Paenibacillus tepidiphilus]|uniref:TetR/AcrR family transcriptional regulator n=1 Tax=Paenibacillus tepidiphilus TaxID=2608683 RepID=UPI001238FF7C|nr:TetR family transcriptional regulator [Paenibacillus tepidiphilus]
MRELKNVEERILDRALYLMGTNRTCDISIRAIAKEAGVNVSAINYYFRSKEEMLRMVKEFYIENTMSVLSILKEEALDVEDKLVLAANEIMEYALRFPGNLVINSHSRKLMQSDEISKRIIDLAQEIGDRLQHLLRLLIPGDETSSQYKYLIFTSAINYPTEYEGTADVGASLLADKPGRMEYIRLLVRALRSV